MDKMRCKNRHGFTLVELLLAATILVVALSGVLLMFNYCHQFIEQSVHFVNATIAAYSQLEVIRSSEYAQIVTFYTANNTFAVPDLVNGAGTVTVAYEPGFATQLIRATVNVAWQERTGNLNVGLTSYIAER